MSTRRHLMRALAVVLAAAPLAACEKLSPSAAKAIVKPFNGVDMTGADYARDLSLPDPSGQPRTLADFKGKVTVVFFGYTHCPDVCPTTLAELAELRRSLGADGDRLQGIFVTVDPERDTPELLKNYIDGFKAGFVALRGSPEQTQAAAKEFKVYYAKVPGPDPASYSVDHTAGSFVFDPDGKVRLFVRYGTAPRALAEDVKQLLAGA